jgi:hypothetical protein
MEAAVAKAKMGKTRLEGFVRRLICRLERLDYSLRAAWHAVPER